MGEINAIGYANILMDFVRGKELDKKSRAKIVSNKNAITLLKYIANGDYIPEYNRKQHMLDGATKTGGNIVLTGKDKNGNIENDTRNGVIKNKSVDNPNADLLETLGDIGKGSTIGEMLSQYGVGHNPKTTTVFGIFDKTLQKSGSGGRIFTVDGPHQMKGGGSIGYPHINVDYVRKWPKITKNEVNSVIKDFNHKEVPQSVYNFAKAGGKISKVVKSGGKALAVAGVALDVYELGNTIHNDLNDKDGRLGKNTVKTTTAIGGSWAGGIAGSKLGGMGGAAVGTLICPGLGTIVGGFIGGIAGGIAGSIGGRAAGEYVIQKTYKGE